VWHGGCILMTMENDNDGRIGIGGERIRNAVISSSIVKPSVCILLLYSILMCWLSPH
jgi:hypothetical protein